MGKTMRRREFIALASGAVLTWPLAGRTQQPAVPVIGFLSAGAESTAAHLTAAFRQGLAEAGYVEGKNLTIEYRFTRLRPELMPEAASALIRRNVNVIFASSAVALAEVRNAATTIPVVALDLESDPWPVRVAI
jgi:ABC-type uncharacterized transport system substrate-binding protein